MNQIQVVIDSLIVLSIGLFPFLIYEYINQDTENPTYDFRQILLCNVALILEYIGQILHVLAMKFGKAGRVQAIESFQSLPTIILSIIYLGQMPNILEDIGFGITLLGLLLIAAQGSSPIKNDEDIEKEEKQKKEDEKKKKAADKKKDGKK